MSVAAVSASRLEGSPKLYPFSSFLPTELSRLRDGGSIIVKGLLNRSVSATIRLDGAINSDTRGQFFVKTKHFLRPEEAERPMTLDELKGLSQALTRYQAQTPGRQEDHAALNRRVKDAIEAFSKPAVAKIPTSISGPNASASVDASLWVDLMPGLTPPSRPVIGSVTVKGVGFNDAPPKFKVPTIKVYEQKTDKLVATIRNPELVEETVRRGEKRNTYRVELPSKDIDLSKKYTFVVSAGINGAAPKPVRSEYVAVDRVY